MIAWGAPGYSLRVALGMSLAERWALPMGTIWSTSPCRIRVGTSIFFQVLGHIGLGERLDLKVSSGKAGEHVLGLAGI
jgi:hypothetical protein